MPSSEINRKETTNIVRPTRLTKPGLLDDMTKGVSNANGSQYKSQLQCNVIYFEISLTIIHNYLIVYYCSNLLL